MTPDRRLTLAPHIAALLGVVINAVPIDAERCPRCGGERESCANYKCPKCWGSFSLPLRMTCRDHNPTLGPCSGSGLVAPQPGQWTLATNDEPPDLTGTPYYILSADGLDPDRFPVPVEHQRLYWLDENSRVVERVPLPAPGQVVGPVTVTAVVPIVGSVVDRPRPFTPYIAAGRHMVTLWTEKPEWGPDHYDYEDITASALLPGLDWTLPYAALIGDTE